VKVRYDEGLVIHIGPEPCDTAREGDGEASAGERMGQPSSRERLQKSRVPTPLSQRKATRMGASSRGLCCKFLIWLMLGYVSIVLQAASTVFHIVDAVSA